MAIKFEGADAYQPSHLSTSKPRQLRVVIVEDDPIISMELEMLLEELNAVVVGVAPSAAEAFEHVQAVLPDFVTMDVNIMGERDGVTVAQEIYDAFGVRSIFISALGDVVTRDRAAPCNQIGWLLKPVSKSDLAALLPRVKRRND